MRLDNRAILSRGFQFTGLTSILERLPQPAGLIALNYHRIGDVSVTQYDPGTFSATADELHEHLLLIRRRHSIVTLDEAIELLSSSKPPS